MASILRHGPGASQGVQAWHGPVASGARQLHDSQEHKLDDGRGALCSGLAVPPLNSFGGGCGGTAVLGAGQHASPTSCTTAAMPAPSLVAAMQLQQQACPQSAPSCTSVNVSFSAGAERSCDVLLCSVLQWSMACCTFLSMLKY